MIDFLMISTRSTKRGTMEIYPKFIIKKSSDLMIRGGDFYAIWIEERGLWSTDEQDALQLIDRELSKFAEENKQRFDGSAKVLYMWDAESGMIDAWHRYCQKQMRDSFHMLDENLIFSNVVTGKKDYASKKLPYPLETGDISAYEKLMNVLYLPEERKKIEWAIGAIVNGDSKKLQKFMVLYGAAGTGKSTVINIIQMLFEGYYSTFSSKALGSSSNVFALEAFKTNPLIAIEHDGDLSKIDDNTRLNSLVSHELMTVNEKFKSTYSSKFKCFLIVGTNKPVKITDAKSGLIRRLIDVSPSGKKVDPGEYRSIMTQIGFELGGIASHCKEVYENDPHAYDDYIPITMLGASNDFYNFVEDSFPVFSKEDGTSLTAAWAMYKEYCEDAKVAFMYPQRAFKEELKNYFWKFEDRTKAADGSRKRNYYSGFRMDRFETNSDKAEVAAYQIEFDEFPSRFDQICSDCPAQYATSKETPSASWDKVQTKLSELDTSKLHYVKVPENHIVIDFDIPDENGNKCFEKNLAEASKWPPTYAELSKSEAGIHLHYIYTGDVSGLSRIYQEHIEVKVFTGKSSLRRKLTKCNDLPIMTISSGLPMKEGKKMVNFEAVKSEKSLRTQIKRNLAKEIHPATKPSIDFIYKILGDAYASGLHYDVTDMRNAILAFAANSSHQSDYCVKLVNKMNFKSDDISEPEESKQKSIVFYDVEVFPNLFLVNWKLRGPGKTIVRMINPRPCDIEELLQFRLVGFNCRRYDNHMLYARLMGYTNEQLFHLSQRIINNSPNCFFGEAYNISYTDIYDFASAGNKKNLKKLEIEMSSKANDSNSKMDEDLRALLKGIKHHELGLPWDQPVPEELWPKVAEYCDNDVLATEASFEYLKADWTARQILADLAGMTVNDTTNTLTQKIIFGNVRMLQGEFRYRNLSEPVTELEPEIFDFLKESCPEMMAQKFSGMDGKESFLPYFPGYKFENGKSFYRGEEVGEGGEVYAEPGIYVDVALLDIASMHPHSTIAEVLFGVRFTRAFREIVEGRVSIKHKAWVEVDAMLSGKLKPYIQRVIDGELTAKDLANALKTAINSVYGLTFANFDNPFRDVRNKDNIVAKRGALFMIDLKYEVQARGFTVAHIKTDSIKIPNATPEIIQFVMDFGKRYGYTFEHEATYDRMCLVNDAVYIAKYKDGEEAGKWTATGTQFQVPYVFKTLFSHEPIRFEDMCETKSVTSALYLDLNEGLPDVSEYEKLLSNDESKYRKGQISDITWESSKRELMPRIAAGHNYRFIGKVGQFCPIRDGDGGGILLREKDGKYYAVGGTKDHRWMESEVVRELGKEDSIDIAYYNTMVDKAVAAISKYGDFERFVSDDPYITEKMPASDFMNIPETDEDELPFD
ncbi:MAG: DUF5906 domain-containing protein [Eubacteriales bacterium]|nr:DUF5906 domain-containing protein [Eubacteriales bacterium]